MAAIHHEFFPLVHEEILFILFSIASAFVMPRQVWCTQNHLSIEVLRHFAFEEGIYEVFTFVGIKADGRRWGQRQAFAAPDCERERPPPPQRYSDRCQSALSSFWKVSIPQRRRQLGGGMRIVTD